MGRKEAEREGERVTGKGVTTEGQRRGGREGRELVRKVGKGTKKKGVELEGKMMKAGIEAGKEGLGEHSKWRKGGK